MIMLSFPNGISADEIYKQLSTFSSFYFAKNAIILRVQNEKSMDFMKDFKKFLKEKKVKYTTKKGSFSRP